MNEPTIPCSRELYSRDIARRAPSRSERRELRHGSPVPHGIERARQLFGLFAWRVHARIHRAEVAELTAQDQGDDDGHDAEASAPRTHRPEATILELRE